MNSLFEKFAKNHNICPLVVMNITSMQRVYCIWWHKLIRGLILNFLNTCSITDTQQRRLKLQAFSEMKNEADRSLLWSNCAERIEHPHCVDILLSTWTSLYFDIWSAFRLRESVYHQNCKGASKSCLKIRSGSSAGLYLFCVDWEAYMEFL